MSANLPILWADKEDSPELKAYLEQFSNKYYFTAAEINQLRDAVNEMAVIQQSTFMGTAEPAATPAGTGNRYWTAVSPGTYANFGGVVVATNSLAIISVTAAGVYSVSQSTLNLSTYQKIVDSNKINFWAAQDYPIGTQRNHLGKDWVANADTIAVDIPGTSSKWVERLKAYNYDNNLFYKAELKAGKNKFNKLKSAPNAISNLGAFIVNSFFIYSDFIPVISGEVYKTSRNFRYTCFFDSKYNYVAGGTETVGQYITIPAGVNFMIVTSYASEIDLFQIELGTVTTVYESFYLKLNSSQFDSSNLVEKTLIKEINPVGYVLKNGNLEWVVGSINKDTGVDESSSSRIKTKEFIKFDKTKSISVSKNSGYSYAIVYYNLISDVYTYSGTSHYYSGNTAIWNTPLGDYFKIVIIKTAGDLIVANITEVGFVIAAYFYDYMPLASFKSVQDLTILVNSVVPFDFTKFNKAYIKNEKLCCNDLNTASTAHYLGLETLTDKPQWLKAGVIWEEGATGGVAAIIANKNGLKLVSNITSKSLHIVFTDTKFDVGLFDGGINAIIHTYTYPTACLRDNSTEYMFGFKVDSVGLTIYAKGETIVYNSITDAKDYLDYAGKFCTFEHFYTSLGKSRPQFNWIEVKDTNNEVIYDDFNRPMGLPVQSPTGYKYTQISN